MRTSFRTLAVAAAFTVGAFVAASVLEAAPDDKDEQDDASAEKAKIAKEALDKAIARGNELFHQKDLGGGKKSCASCHENPEKPKLDLKTRAFSYPAYSNKAKAVVTLGTKINEMLTNNS